MLNINELLTELVKRRGSDLHLMAGLAPAIRIDGELQSLDLAPLNPDQIQSAIFGLLTPAQVKEFQESPTTRGELDFSYGLRSVGRFRFNIHRQRGTVAAVVRAIPDHIPQLESLNLPIDISNMTQQSSGLILVTGPTGSGKSTTLASLIDHINETRQGHIITIEDPVEYLHRPKNCYITQREVGLGGDTLNFHNALKYALRQDPDVILVGELRDYETVGTALAAAETGHLVFGSLHTPSAAQAVSRIVDVFPAERQQQIAIQLSTTLISVVSQLLLRTKEGNGRIPAIEVMHATPAVRSLIRDNKIAALDQVIETGTNQGMISMDRSLLKLVETGIISAETALRHMRNEHSIKQVSRHLHAA